MSNHPYIPFPPTAALSDYATQLHIMELQGSPLHPNLNFAIPFTTRCSRCSTYMPQGRVVSAIRQQPNVQNLSTIELLRRTRIGVSCPGCSQLIVWYLDPDIRGYRVVSGARQVMQDELVQLRWPAQALQPVGPLMRPYIGPPAQLRAGAPAQQPFGLPMQQAIGFSAQQPLGVPVRQPTRPPIQQQVHPIAQQPAGFFSGQSSASDHSEAGEETFEGPTESTEERARERARRAAESDAKDKAEEEERQAAETEVTETRRRELNALRRVSLALKLVADPDNYDAIMKDAEGLGPEKRISVAETGGGPAPARGRKRKRSDDFADDYFPDFFRVRTE